MSILAVTAEAIIAIITLVIIVVIHVVIRGFIIRLTIAPIVAVIVAHTLADIHLIIVLVEAITEDTAEVTFAGIVEALGRVIYSERETATEVIVLFLAEDITLIEEEAEA